MGVLILVCTLAAPSGGAATPHWHPPNPGAVTIAVKVNGISLRMLVDTGAQRSCLDTGVMPKLGIKSVATAAVITPYGNTSTREIAVRTLEIASFHMEDAAMIVIDMSSMSSASGLRLDGILGTDILKLLPLRIDFSEDVAQPLPLVEVSSVSDVVDLDEADGLFYCATVIQGVPLRLLLDTGTNLSNISSAAWKRVTAEWEPRSVVRGVRSSGGPDETNLALVPDLTLAASQLHELAVRVQPPTSAGLYADQTFDGLLGTNFLESYLVVLDLPHSRLLLSPRRKQSRDSLLFSTVGIQFAKDADGTFKIMAVWTPSPAAVAGLEVGDRILEVNGSDSRPMTPAELSQCIHQRPGTKVRLLIDSRGTVHATDVKCQCLLCVVKQSDTGKGSRR